VDYVQSLRSGDVFDVSVEPVRISALRLGFQQQIIHETSRKLMLKALIVTTAVNERGRPWFPAELEKLLL
jgi:acyl-CoA thioester hydrolase